MNTDQNAAKTRKVPWRLIWTLVGALSLVWLLATTPLEEAWQEASAIGAAMALVVMVAPLWFAANAVALWQLTGRTIGLGHLFYNQMVGDALGAMLPVAGIGGEPFKLGHLRRWLSVEEASQALVYDRLLHALSGLLYLAGLLAVSAWLVALPAHLLTAFVGVSVALVVVSGALLMLTLSSAPSKALKGLLGRFKLVGRLQALPKLPASTLLKALGAKLVGRVAHMPELWLIAVLMGMDGSLGQVALIGAMLTGSSLLFFVVPQGLGVNEAGVTGAFSLLGLGAPQGLAFALVRRARVLFWIGVGVTVVSLGRLRPAAPQVAITDAATTASIQRALATVRHGVPPAGLPTGLGTASLRSPTPRTSLRSTP